MGHGIAVGAELAPLSGDSTEGRGAGRLEASMIVADDELDTSHSPHEEAFKELSPVGFRFIHGDAAAQDGSLAVWGDPEGGERGTRYHGPSVPDFFVSDIEDLIGEFTEWLVSPGTQLLVQFGCRSADLR